MNLLYLIITKRNKEDFEVEKSKSISINYESSDTISISGGVKNE